MKKVIKGNPVLLGGKQDNWVLVLLAEVLTGKAVTSICLCSSFQMLSYYVLKLLFATFLY